MGLQRNGTYEFVCVAEGEGATDETESAAEARGEDVFEAEDAVVTGRRRRLPFATSQPRDPGVRELVETDNSTAEELPLLEPGVVLPRLEDPHRAVLRVPPELHDSHAPPLQGAEVHILLEEHPETKDLQPEASAWERNGGQDR